MFGLFRLAKTAIMSFSTVPLSLFYVIAALSIATCVTVCGFTVYHKLFTGLAIPGWASQTMVASFFGAINALGIGVLGEYAVRIYDQVRGRPTYVVSRHVNFAAASASVELPENEQAILAFLNDYPALREQLQHGGQATSRPQRAGQQMGHSPK